MAFLKRVNGKNVYKFACPSCGSTGEVGVPQKSTKLFSHGVDGCSALFIQQQPASGMYARPRLVVVFSGEGSELEKRYYSPERVAFREAMDKPTCPPRREDFNVE